MTCRLILGRDPSPLTEQSLRHLRVTGLTALYHSVAGLGASILPLEQSNATGTMRQMEMRKRALTEVRYQVECVLQAAPQT